MFMILQRMCFQDGDLVFYSCFGLERMALWDCGDWCGLRAETRKEDKVRFVVRGPQTTQNDFPEQFP